MSYFHFAKKNLWHCLATVREKIDNCANSSIINILVHGLLNTLPYFLHFRGQFWEAKLFFFDRKETKWNFAISVKKRDGDKIQTEIKFENHAEGE